MAAGLALGLAVGACAALQGPAAALAATQRGIDVSAWQGPSINWGAVAGSGVSFAFIRAAEGSGSPDGDFQENWRGAAAAGVTPGAYLFFHPSDNPVAQANLLVSQLRSVGFTHGDLLPTIDVETTDNLPQPVVVANLLTTVDAVSAAIGSLPAIYTAPSWWDSHIGSSAFTLDPLWVANWGVSSPALPANRWGGLGWAVWQYSDAGVVPGVPGRVDLDQGGSGPLPFYGWPDPVALPAANVAGIPQAVSDRPGDVDVAWRGSGGSLWTIGYRGHRWAAGAGVITASGVASDPTLTSWGPQRIDAFWLGTDGNVWHAAFVGGWFGTGTWSLPDSLGAGAAGAPPRAVSAGAGLLDVMWRGADGRLWDDHYAGAWSGAHPVAAGPVGGNPVPVAAGGGLVHVFWRDTAGALWGVDEASWGWLQPYRLTTSSLPADPKALAAAGGAVDLFWPGAGGNLWHASVSGGTLSGAAAISTQGGAGSPAVVRLSTGATLLDMRQANGTLASALYTPAGLVGPEGLGPGQVPADPSAVAFDGSGVDVVWHDAGGRLWYSPACPACAAPDVSAFGPA